MPKTALSDVGVRNTEPPTTGQITLWDSSFKHGMFGCRISQGGSKTFIIKHKGRRITLGRFPTITLSQARTEAKRLFAEFTLGKSKPHSLPYSKAVEAFLEEKKKRRRESTVEAYEGILNRLSFAGSVADITPEQVRRRLEKRPNYNHNLVALRVFFGWCIKRGYRDNDPTLGLSQHNTQARTRVLSDEELQCIWRACEQTGEVSLEAERPSGLLARADCAARNAVSKSALPRLPTNYATIVQLLILTGQRKTEIASLQTSWITSTSNGGLECGKSQTEATSSAADLWQMTLPASITKNGREHVLPIGPMASRIISSTPTSENSMLFPARGRATCFNGWSKSKAALDKLCGVKSWTLHDLRRTFRTIHAKIGTPDHIAERLVNHVSAQSLMERTYNQHRYLEEMRVAMVNYEQALKGILGLDS